MEKRMRKRRLYVGTYLLLIGSAGIVRFNGDPRLLAPGAPGITFHGAGVLGLIGSGICLGVSFAALSGLFKFRDE
jgi:hypothetical protein